MRSTVDLPLAPARARDPDLPMRVLGVFVHLDDPLPHARTVQGMPRAVNTLVGRIAGADWSDDTTVTIVVAWARAGEWLAELADRGDLTWFYDGHHVLVAPRPPS